MVTLMLVLAFTFSFKGCNRNAGFDDDSDTTSDRYDAQVKAPLYRMLAILFFILLLLLLAVSMTFLYLVRRDHT